MSTEVFGDATRGDAWAAARLTVDGERIAAADAPGLERSVVGLTLLEAAAVSGEPLAVEALASALAQVFRAEPAPGRVAVAMSGGVDSAVALLRAGSRAVGVTLRLWQDPAAPDTERACCSPAAVAAARATCHALGLPHRDARSPRGVQEHDRRSVLPCVRVGGDAEPVHALQRRVSLRRARRVRRAGGSRTSSGPATTRESSSATGSRSSPAPWTSGRTSRTCSPPWSRASSSGSASRWASRRRRRRGRKRRAAGLAAARRAESQEACFLGGDDYRAFLERQGVRSEHGDVVDDGRGPARRRTTATGGSRPVSGAASGERRRVAVRRCGPTRRRTPSSVGSHDRLATTTVEARGRLHVPVTTGAVKLRYRSAPVPARSCRRTTASCSSSTSPCTASPAVSSRSLYDDDVVVGAGAITTVA